MIATWIKSLTQTTDDRRFLYERLVKDSYRPIFNMAYRLIGNRHEAEDLVQETLVRAWRFFGKFDASLSFNSWIYRIMGNVFVDSLRRRGRLTTVSLDQGGVDGDQAWDVPDSTYAPDLALMGANLEEPLQNGLNRMTPEFRIAVVLADIEGLSYEEVAEVMETTVGTVRSRIHRGRKQLRNYLRTEYPGRYEVSVQ